MKSLFVLLISILHITVIAQTDSKNFIDQNYIEVRGRAEMHITPDRIYLSIKLSEKDTKNKVAIPQLERKMIDKLQAIGIDVSKDLQVKDIASNFRTSFLSKNDVLLTKHYQLLVYDGKTAGQVFLELEKIDISNISVEKLDHCKIIEFQDKVKVDAIKAARNKAKLLTAAIDQQIGKALYIAESINWKPPNATGNFVRFYDRESAYQEKFADIDFEKLRLEYAVLCKFELK